MLIKIVNVSVETVPSGKGRSYEKAVVMYDANGREQKFTLMSFTNPAVFKAIKDSTPGQEFEVVVGKNDKGYDTWTSVNAVAAGSVSSAAPRTATVAKSTYETPEERKLKQLYIIKQSSISNALAYYKDTIGEPVTVEKVIETAQQFVDWIYDIPLETLDNDL
jgi:hypothetical protein